MDGFNFKWYEFLKQQNQNISPEVEEMVKKWEDQKVISKKVYEKFKVYFQDENGKIE